jgi:uncharacterized small protein (TIGR04563 family)
VVEVSRWQSLQNRPQSFYLSERDRRELHAEAERLGISLSRVAQMAWRIAKLSIRDIPTPVEPYGTPDESPGLNAAKMNRS